MNTTMTTRVAVVGFALCCWSGICEATVIEFAPLSGPNASPYAGHVEAGFQVTPVFGDWNEAHAFGDPTPSIFFRPSTNAFQPGVIEVIELSSGRFFFDSVDIADANSPGNNDVTLDIEGFLGGNPVFSAFGLGPAASSFSSIPSPDTNSAIDQLRLTLNDPTGTTSNIDNIVVRATIPEPAGMALVVGIGLPGLLLRVRRSRRAANESSGDA